LIIDLALPRLSGLEVLERLRDVAPGFLPRTVVVSADDSLLRGNAEVLRSVSCVLRKPFDIDLLGDELRRCIAIALSTPGEVPSSTRLSRSRGRFH
jgi:CheY-like chemotaxis protein